MRSIRLIAIILAVLVGFTSCSRDPNVVKKRYLESGNKYFEKGRYKEASIQYRNALKRDPKYGPAYYKLALVSMKGGDVGGAVSAFRRAIELIPADQPDHWDSKIKLSEVYLAAGRGQQQYMDDVDKYTKDLLKRDPESYDGHRLIGDLNYVRALDAYRNKPPRSEEGAALLTAAMAEYTKADSLKPGQLLVWMQLARAHGLKSDFSGAEAYYRRVIEKDKTFLAAYSELYRLFVYQNKPADGEQILRSGFASNPKQYAFLELLAAQYYAMQRRDDMVAILNQIKSHAKDYDRAYQSVGDFYLRMGDGDSAIREYKEGIVKDAARKASYQKRIIEVLMRQGKRPEAAEINAQILKENPNDNDARGLAATFLLDKGDVAKALAELQEVVTRAPENPVSRYNLGRAHAYRGEYEQARQQFQKAIEYRGDYVLARLALAELQVGHGDYEAAGKTAEAVLNIDKGNVAARLIQSAAMMGQKKFPEARAMLDAMLKGYPGSPDVLFQLGVVNLAEGKYKDAEDAFRRSYQLNPANSRGLMGIVETFISQNKWDEALNILQAESAKSPARLELQLALGNTAVRAGKYDLAVQVFTGLVSHVDKGRTQGDLYLRIGEVYRRKGDANGAVQALQKARETLPDNIIVLSTLALVLDGAGRKPEAKQVYEATLKIDPNNAVALNNLAFLLAETGGDLDLALTEAQRAKQLKPELFEISDTLGWIYLKKNLADNAIEIFKGLVAKEPSHSTYRFHLGMAYSQKGDKSKAIEQLKEALKYNPAPDEKSKIQALITRLG